MSVRSGDAEVRIAPCTDEDRGFLAALAALAPERWLRVCRRGLPNPHDVIRAAWEGVACQYVVYADGAPVGITSVHDLSLRHATAWIDVVVLEPHDRVVGAAAARHLIDDAFGRWPLRALYASYLDLQPSPFALAGVDHEVEARLAAAYRHEGTSWDGVIAVTRRHPWANGRGTR